jgi:hypothetical protein
MTLRPTFPEHIERGQQMSLLSIELSRERIRDAQRDAARRRSVARARAARRARRDAEVTALRLRRMTMR